MPTIRSLLWIGSGRGLAASGITEAPELDVTWVPDLAEAAKLPRVPFDGVLLEAEGAGAIGAAVARASRKLVEILERITHGGRPEETFRQTVDRVEAWLIHRSLANSGGQKASTARRPGITRE